MTWVSTPIAGWPKALPSRMFAVLRPRRKRGQLLDRLRHSAAETLNELLAAALDRFGLVAIEAGGRMSASSSAAATGRSPAVRYFLKAAHR